MKRKIVSGILACSMIGTMILTGCSGSDSTGGSAAGGSDKNAETDSRFTYDGDDVTLNFMYITGGDNEFYSDQLPELINEQFPNITVEVEEMPTDNYKSTVQMKFASGEGPDIFEWWPDKQAELLPRSYLLLQACGVKKVFSYCFQSTERKAWDIESYFGIVDRELKPQKSFYAYKTMTAHCPPGSSSPVLTNTDVCYIAHWRKPDQTPVWAIWTEQYPKRLKLNIKGKVISAVNHIGEKVDLTDKYVVSPSVTYIVGPSSVSIK